MGFDIDKEIEALEKRYENNGMSKLRITNSKDHDKMIAIRTKCNIFLCDLKTSNESFAMLYQFVVFGKGYRYSNYSNLLAANNHLHDTTRALQHIFKFYYTIFNTDQIHAGIVLDTLANIKLKLQFVQNITNAAAWRLIRAESVGSIPFHHIRIQVLDALPAVQIHIDPSKIIEYLETKLKVGGRLANQIGSDLKTLNEHLEEMISGMMKGASNPT